jgi:hypothetical protein
MKPQSKAQCDATDSSNNGAANSEPKTLNGLSEGQEMVQAHG